MPDLLTTLKPHFFPHYACFQYGVGGYELWLARRCVQYVIATDSQDDYEFIADAKEWLELPGLMPYFRPTDYAISVLQFSVNHFNLIYVYIEPDRFSAIARDVVTRLKPGGYLVLPTRQRLEIVLDWKELGEGVYRKPHG